MEEKTKLIAAPVATATTASSNQPQYVRLPQAGQLEPHTGLGRSFLNSLILPSPANHFKPPVRSISLRKPGRRFGVRLIDYADLLRWIRLHESTAVSGEAQRQEAAIERN